jgi:hypothetical protein
MAQASHITFSLERPCSSIERVGCAHTMVGEEYEVIFVDLQSRELVRHTKDGRSEQRTIVPHGAARARALLAVRGRQLHIQESPFNTPISQAEHDVTAIVTEDKPSVQFSSLNP